VLIVEDDRAPAVIRVGSLISGMRATGHGIVRLEQNAALHE
jgi:hypothetical protein